jgi:hypothetical protein
MDNNSQRPDIGTTTTADETAAPTNAAATEEQVVSTAWTRRHAILYRIELSVLYHRRRERFFDAWDRCIKLYSAIAAALTAYQLRGGEGTFLAKILAWSVAAAQAASFVFSLGANAKRHSDFARSFRLLEAEVLKKGQYDYADSLDEWDSRIRELESTEPLELGLLVRICQNQLAIAQGQRDLLQPVPWWGRPFAQLFDFDLDNIPHTKPPQSEQLA